MDEGDFSCYEIQFNPEIILPVEIFSRVSTAYPPPLRSKI